MSKKDANIFMQLLEQRVRIAISHYHVALKELESVERQAEREGYRLDRMSGNLEIIEKIER